MLYGVMSPQDQLKPPSSTLVFSLSVIIVLDGQESIQQILALLPNICILEYKLRYLDIFVTVEVPTDVFV